MEELFKKLVDKLDQIEFNQAAVNRRLDKIENTLSDLKLQVVSSLDGAESKTALLEKKISDVKWEVSEIRATANLLNAISPQETMGMLKQISATLNKDNSEVQVIQDRLVAMERDINHFFEKANRNERELAYIKSQTNH